MLKSVGVRQPQNPQMRGLADKFLYSQLHPLHTQMDLSFCAENFPTSVQPTWKWQNLRVGLTELWMHCIYLLCKYRRAWFTNASRSAGDVRAFSSSPETTGTSIMHRTILQSSLTFYTGNDRANKYNLYSLREKSLHDWRNIKQKNMTWPKANNSPVE